MRIESGAPQGVWTPQDFLVLARTIPKLTAHLQVVTPVTRSNWKIGVQLHSSRTDARSEAIVVAARQDAQAADRWLPELEAVRRTHYTGVRLKL